MHEVKSIQDLLNQISRDEILLPEFQRGYVWNRDQVRARRADACRWWFGGGSGVQRAALWHVSLGGSLHGTAEGGAGGVE